MATLAETKKRTQQGEWGAESFIPGQQADFGPGGAQSAYDAPPGQPKPTHMLGPAPKTTGSPITGWKPSTTAGSGPSVSVDPNWGYYLRPYEGPSPQEATIRRPAGSMPRNIITRGATGGGGATTPNPALMGSKALTAYQQQQLLQKSQEQFPIGQVQTTSYKPPEGPVPELGEMPEFAPPKYQKGEVRKLRQRAAAPRLREMRRALQVALTRQYANPNMRRMALRDALQGYGIGVESIMAGAQTEATGVYAQQYAAMQQAQQAEYQTEVKARFQRYSDAMTAWQKGFQPVTETRKIYGTQAGAGAIREVTTV